MESGKIYWLFGDFKILNTKDPDCWDSVAKIEPNSWLLDPNMIRFYTEDDENGSGLTVNMVTDTSNYYRGKAIISETGEEYAKVEGELFENTNKFLLKGTWIEFNDDREDFYTWILILKKKK
ncbi:hypothetical protein ACPUEN_11690 [Algoriphagus yeomjeoni]|uniref:hypothetical protein n=1 Tax=Algoriphagus yeomjeoni TaxID=291403 RepID=UPI003CE52C5C